MTETAFSSAPPADFAFTLSLPSGVPALMNPSSLAYDRHYGEIYVADTGNNRVVIFDRTGNYVFEFSDRLRLASPRMIATDSLGHILALCDRTADHIEVFDYNGTFLRDIALVSPHGDSLVTASSFAIDDSDRVYVLTGEPGHVFVYATDGTPLRDFAIFQEFNRVEDRSQSVLGTMTCVNSTLIIPLPMMSQLVVYKTSGEFVRVFGFGGGGPGLLSFPVASASDGQGGLLVLDKHRDAILQYDSVGKFKQEFSGLGMDPGWLYHPISIAADGAATCFVLQSFLGRAQAFHIPGKTASADTQISVAPSTPSPARAATIK